MSFSFLFISAGSITQNKIRQSKNSVEYLYMPTMNELIKFTYLKISK